MQEKIEKYVQDYNEYSKKIAREYRLARLFAWISLLLIILTMTLVIVKASHAGVNSAAQASASAGAYGGQGSLSGLISYGKTNISLTPSGCTNTSNFLSAEYSITSTGDIDAVIQMNTNNGSGYNYSYPIPVLISGVCSNGIISCPAGEWYGNGVTCNNYAIHYSPSTGFSLSPLGSAIMGTPQTTQVNVPLNGTQVSTVTSTQTSGGLANCIDINDATGSTPASETEVQQVLTDLGGQVSSAVQKGSSDIIGGVTQNTANSPYSQTYSGGTCSSSDYNSPNNLEGLYNEGGSSLNNEVSSSEVSTANSNTQSALGLTSTPNQMLINVQNTSFGNTNSGGLCQIQNQVSFQSSSTYTNAVFVSSSPVYSNAVGIGMGGGQSCVNGSCWSSAPNTIILSTNNPQSTCSPEELPGGITISGDTMTGSGACSGTVTLNSSSGINAGGVITCNLSDDGCNAGGTLTFTGGGSSLIISGSNSATASISEVYSYYPQYTQPENTCGSTKGCTLESEQVCDQNDKNCQYTMEHGSSTGVDPDFTWTKSQTDQNLNPPSPSITWTVSMDGSSVQVTPSETVDTTGAGNLATSSNNSLYPTVNEIWNCQTNSPFNFSKMNQQETAVTGSASMNSNNTAFSYTGVNGNYYNNIAINNTVNNATQEECVVQETTTNASVSSSVQATTATQNTPSSNTTTNTETLNCTNTGTVNNPSWSCPVPSGYTVQTNCTDASTINNNNFAPAMVELQVLDKAGSSLICSAN